MHREVPVSGSGPEPTQPALAGLLDGALRAARQRLSADTAAVLLLDDSRQYLIATAAAGVEDEVREGSRVRAGRGFAGRIAVERRPVILDEVTPDNVVNPVLLRRGIASMLGVPLFIDTGPRVEVIGVLHVGSLTPRRFTADDVAVLEEAGRTVADVLVQHRSFVDRAAASALQNSLASSLPDIAGLDLAARYVAGSRYGVGGDWYDAFELPSGDVGIALGDVMGHGLHAATVMGRARSVLRAYALEHDDPAEVLSRLDRQIRYFEPGLIATVSYAVYDPALGLLHISSSGHLPPVLFHGRGTAEPLTIPVDPPIGVVADAPRRTTVTELSPGTVACLFTDGLVERRGIDIDAQIALVCRTIEDSFTGSADRLCADIMGQLLQSHDPADDVSLLAVHRLPDGQ
jgi:sigma-B regulation protein RsbU (phosphoserine phosphatase)